MAGLKARGHEVEVADIAKADSYDVVVFSKAYSAEDRRLARSVKERGGRVVFDLCDNHFYNPFDLPKYRNVRKEIGEMISLSDRVICSTPALARVIREEMDDRFEPNVIGDIVERYPAARQSRGAGEPTRLIWYGSHGSPNAPCGMTDLLLIREQLEALAAKWPVELTVCSNNQEKYERTIAPMGVPTRYVEWSLDSFPSLLVDSDAVLLPMSINPFTACKTHNRLTTALYSGVPVIASKIDSYQEFARYCTLDDWTGGLRAVVEAGDEERKRALDARDHIDSRWSNEALAAQWEAALSLPLSRVRARETIKLHGRLDAVAHTAVTGWVRAPLNDDLRIQVVLECGGEPVAVATADRPRADLKAAGLPSNCGFSLPLPPRLATATAPQLTVRALESDWVIGENPILIDQAGRPSISPTAFGALSSSREERWEVAETVAAQERSFAELVKSHQADARRAAASLNAAFAADGEDFADLSFGRQRPTAGMRELLRETDTAF